MASAAVKRLKRENQSMNTFCNFYSVTDLADLANEAKSVHEKIDIVAARLVKVRLWLPSEKAIKAVMQAAVARKVARKASTRIPLTLNKPSTLIPLT